ncbi:MAG: hypothetical protein RQ862_03475 [Candidatus Caldarchaeales archaeon]|jgi:hypothetical protein|nr:hypothetical protein [Candidatus Caldarchaeales archaeon]
MTRAMQVATAFSEVAYPLIAVACGIYFKSPAFALASIIIFTLAHLGFYTATDEMPKSPSFVPVFPIVQVICLLLFFALFCRSQLSSLQIWLGVIAFVANYVLLYPLGVKAAKTVNPYYSTETKVVGDILMCLAGLAVAVTVLVKGFLVASIVLLLTASFTIPHLQMGAKPQGGESDAHEDTSGKGSLNDGLFN